jgi:nucleotide-binding universal stress UspA family protein
MFQRILVPLDGSSRAERSLPIAACIARASAGTIVLLRVVSTPSEFLPSLVPPLPSASAQTLIEVERAEAVRYLARIATSEILAGILTETVVLVGSVASAILSVAHTQQSDLIVMCSHGYTDITHWRLGSIAEKIAHHCSLPVLILHEDGPIPTGSQSGAKRPLRVLVPLDGSHQAETALMPAVYLITALAAPAQGALHLMQVVKLPSAADEQRYRAYISDSMREHMQREATCYLTKLVDRLRTGTLAGTPQSFLSLQMPITWSVALAEVVDETLIRAAENEEAAVIVGGFGGCDVIAMAPYGRGGVSRWLLGNVAERILHATKLPVFIVRQQSRMNETYPTEDKVTISGTHT